MRGLEQTEREAAALQAAEEARLQAAEAAEEARRVQEREAANQTLTLIKL